MKWSLSANQDQIPTKKKKRLKLLKITKWLQSCTNGNIPIPCYLGHIPSYLGHIPSYLGHVSSYLGQIPSYLGNIPNYLE